ncbi:hypothetical protein NM688_g713 [Phlebia brevispora]|uniref:Uncharacterized protein n=1 Tax=Phlebia brevispora TaxID=194682 RepID=A0ACC1TDG1_9APHY|nr:hypothetical protein NM688_g713 [Phlebia brevispora]
MMPKIKGMSEDEMEESQADVESEGDRCVVVLGKRVRTESPSPSLAPEPQEHESLWFDDGNIILRAEDTMFRVYRGVLCRASDVFKDLFDIPQPSDPETIDGIPVVRMPDSALELADVLDILFNNTQFIKQDIKPQWAVVQSLMRLSSKYDMSTFRDAALYYINRLTLGPSAQKRKRLYDFSAGAIAYEAADLIAMVNLIRSFDLGKSLRRDSLYACSQLSIQQLTEGMLHSRGHVERLPAGDLLLCLQLREQLTAESSQLIHAIPSIVNAHGCSAVAQSWTIKYGTKRGSDTKRMSSTGPSGHRGTKRARVDTDPEPSELNRHETLWFEDGNVIVQAGDTIFRVYRGLLCQYSDVFKDLFKLPQPADAETMDGLPLVQLSDSPVELAHLLDALHNAPQHEKLTWTAIQSLVNLGMKYEIEELRDAAIHHIHGLTLDTPERRARLYDPSKSCIIYEPADIIAMANLLQTLDLRLAELFDGMRHSHGHVERLSKSNLRICITTRERLQRRTVDLAFREQTWYRKRVGACNVEMFLRVVQERDITLHRLRCSPHASDISEVILGTVWYTYCVLQGFTVFASSPAVSRCWLLVALEAAGLVSTSDRIDVPLMFDSWGRYAVDVSMYSMSSPQNVNLTISTSTGLTYVVGAGASTGSSHALTAAQTVTTFAKAPFFGEVINATISKEMCNFPTTNGTSWHYSNQTVAFISNPNNSVAVPASLGADMSSVLGLGTNVRSSGLPPGLYEATFQDSIPGQYLSHYPDMDNFTFGLALEKPVMRAELINSSSASTQRSPFESLPAGMLHLLQTDEALYDANNVSWVTANVSVALNSTSLSGSSSVPAGDWSFFLDGWIFQTDKDELRSKSQIVANVDPLYTGIYIPQDQAMLIHDAIPGAIQSNFSTLGRLSQAWMLPCNSSFSFALVIGGQNFALDESVLVINQNLTNNMCVSGIEAWTDSSQTIYLFGSRFMSSVYMIFNVATNGTQTIGFAPRSSSINPPSSDTSSSESSHPAIGPIVGGTLGGFFLIVLTGVAFYFILRHVSFRSVLPNHRTNQKEEFSMSESKLPGMIEPFTLLQPSAVEAYNERAPRATRRSPSPISIIFSHPADLANEDEDRKATKAPPPSYRYSNAFDLEAPDRIYQSRGNISLASASINGSMVHTPVSVSAPTVATMATCG